MRSEYESHEEVSGQNCDEDRKMKTSLTADEHIAGDGAHDSSSYTEVRADTKVDFTP